MVHFGNTTNNRLKNANGRLKKKKHHADRLEHAMRKITFQDERLMREYEMPSIYICARRLMPRGDFYVRRALKRMTMYAALMVSRHLGSRVPQARFV